MPLQNVLCLLLSTCVVQILCVYALLTSCLVQRLKQISVNIICKNHYMLISKYIFVIFLSLLIINSFRGMAPEGKTRPPRILKFDVFPSNFCKKCFLNFETWNEIFPLLAPAEMFWPTPGKNTFGPCLEKMLPAPVFRCACSSIEMLMGYMARESLGTPGLVHWKSG